MLSRLRLPSPATMIACLALFFAIGGSAIALQGRNTVDSGDIKPKAVKTSDIANNAVTTKKIKNNHVRAADIQNNAVGTGEIRNGQVAAGDLALQEAYRKIGAAGQPAFNNGVEGDCLWTGAVSPPIRINPVAFYKDAFGRVHLSGIAQSVDGPGGDAACGGAGDEQIEDSVVFILPEGYRPVNDEIRDGGLASPEPFLIIGSTPLIVPGGSVPARAVIPLSITARPVGFGRHLLPRCGPRDGSPAPRFGRRWRAAGECGRPVRLTASTTLSPARRFAGPGKACRQA